MEWELPCADGSDRHCHKHVKVEDIRGQTTVFLKTPIKRTPTLIA